MRVDSTTTPFRAFNVACRAVAVQWPQGAHMSLSTHATLVALFCTFLWAAAVACESGNPSSTPQSSEPSGSPSRLVTGRSVPSTVHPQPTLVASATRGGGDAIALCAKYGTVDFPAQDPRYTGSPLPLQITEILQAQPSGSYARPSDYYVYLAWRCIEGHVYSCVRDCGYYAYTTDRLNDAMATYCRQNPDASYIPDEVVGVAAKWDYQWVCVGGVATIDRKHNPVDAQGFVANSWGRLPEPRS